MSSLLTTTAALLALSSMLPNPDTTAVRRIAVAPAETLSVTLAGEGEPVVIVPGMIGSAYTWRNVVSELVAAGKRVVLVEPLGTGASGTPAEADYSLTAQADRLAAVLDTLNVSAAVVLCHGLGGSMTLRLAYRRPDLVDGIVSVNGGPAEAAATPGLKRALKFAPLIKLFAGKDFVRNKLRDGMVESSVDSTWVTPDVVQGYMDPIGGDVDDLLATLQRFASAVEPEALTPHLREIRAPVLLLVGRDGLSGVVNREEIGILTDSLPRFTLDRLDDAGQYIQEEKPAVVARAVLDLMNETVYSDGR